MYTDISHFRAPYKNWPYLGVGADATPDSSTVTTPSAPTPDASTPTTVAATPAQTLDALSTVDADGIRTLTPAAALAMTPFLTNASYLVMTTAPDKEQIFVPGTPISVPAGSPMPAFNSVMAWITDALSKGRSVILSTNDPAGLVSIIGTGTLSPSSQLVLASVSSKADEKVGADQSTGAALYAPSKLKKAAIVPALVANTTGLGKFGVAALVVLGVGGAVLLIGSQKHRRAVTAMANPRRRRRSRRR
jgi:hypothetical protein